MRNMLRILNPRPRPADRPYHAPSATVSEHATIATTVPTPACSVRSMCDVRLVNVTSRNSWNSAMAAVTDASVATCLCARHMFVTLATNAVSLAIEYRSFASTISCQRPATVNVRHMTTANSTHWYLQRLTVYFIESIFYKNISFGENRIFIFNFIDNYLNTVKS